MSIQPVPPSSGPTTAGQLAARATQNDQALAAWLDDHEDRVTELESRSGAPGAGEVTITTASFTITEPGDYVAAVSTVVTLPTVTSMTLTPGQFVVVRRYGDEWFFKVGSLDDAGRLPGVTYLDGGWDPTQAATWTFPAMNLGDPAADRVILVAVLIDHAGRDLTSVTIGGVTADLIATGSAVTYTRTVQLAAAVVPTGTSGDVVVTAGGWGTNQIGLMMQMARLVNVEAVPYLAQVNPVEHVTYDSNATIPAVPAGNLVVVAASSIQVPGPIDRAKPTNWANGDAVTPLGPPVGNGSANESAVFFGTFTSDGNTRAVDGRTISTTDVISRAGAHAWAVYRPRSS